MNDTTHSSRLLLIILILIALLSFAMRLIPEPRTIDDAFITFRYSRNIVEGKGFVYNPGSKTLGTTTPLYTLLMAGIGIVTGSDNYPWFALITNALADSITAVLLALLFYRATQRLSGAVALGVLWAVSPMSVTFAVGGMETSVAVLWSVAAAYCYFTKHERWMAVFAALGVLTRIDALMWVGLLILHQLITNWREKRNLPWISWGIFGGLLAPWFLFSLLYFHVLIPGSLGAKKAAYVTGSFQALIRLLQHVATPFMEYMTFGVPAIIVGVILFPFLSGVGIYYAVRRIPRLVPFLVYPWVYFAAFSIANPQIFRWYLTPMLPAYFMAILLGIWAIVTSTTSATSTSPAASASEKAPRVIPITLSLAGIIFLGFSLNAWVLHPDHGPNRPAPDMAWHQIEIYYRQMGEKLRNQCGVTENTIVAAGDIGAVGYYSRAHILDTVGLVTPELTKYYPADRSIFVKDMNYAIPPAIIFDYQPEYVIVMEAFIRNGLAKDPHFAQQYELIDSIPTDFYGTGMLLYQRKSADPNFKLCTG